MSTRSGKWLVAGTVAIGMLAPRPRRPTRTPSSSETTDGLVEGVLLFNLGVEIGHSPPSRSSSASTLLVRKIRYVRERDKTHPRRQAVLIAVGLVAAVLLGIST